MRGLGSWLNVLGVTLGGVGTAACLAAAVLTWIGSGRIRDGIDSLFGRMDGSLAIVGQRLAQARNGVDGATRTTSVLATTLREQVRIEAGERMASRLRIAEKAGRLSSALGQMDHWLAVSESSVSLVQDRLLLRAYTGMTTDTTPVDQLLESIASLRLKLAEAMECADRIRERASGTDEAESRDEANGPSVQLAGRALAALGVIDSGMAKLSIGLSATQSRLQETRSETNRMILLVTCGVTLLLAWLCAGQAALCLAAWRRRR